MYINEVCRASLFGARRSAQVQVIFGNMASEIMNEMLTEDKLVQMWPDFPCLYDVQSSAFKNRNLRQQAMETIVGRHFNKQRTRHNTITSDHKVPACSPSATYEIFAAAVVR